VEGWHLPVRDEAGRVVFYLDMADEAQRVGVEYDGAYHVGDRATMESDRARRRWLEDRGWRLIPATAADLRDGRALVASVRQALAARGGGPRSSRRGVRALV